MLLSGRTLVVLLVGLGLFSPAAGVRAQPVQPTEPHPIPMTNGMTAGPMSTPSAQAYMGAMRRMGERISTPMTGNPDADFVAGMLPHHQGAIDMAAIELKYGTDPGLRKLARAIIVAQRREISDMKNWLSHHPAPASGLKPN